MDSVTIVVTILREEISNIVTLKSVEETTRWSSVTRKSVIMWSSLIRWLKRIELLSWSSLVTISSFQWYSLIEVLDILKAIFVRSRSHLSIFPQTRDKNWIRSTYFCIRVSLLEDEALIGVVAR